MPNANPIRFSAGFVRDALRGYAKVIANKFDADRNYLKASTDSRAIQKGDLFIALKGEMFDGHDFIAKAVELGAVAVLCEKYPAEATQDGIDIYLVESSLNSYRELAKQWRECVDPKVVAVAGSVGKTSTKDILAALVSEKFKNLVWTKGSQNGFVGLPMTLLEIKPDTEAAIIEVGIDAPGAMIQHIDVVRPEVSLVTAISEEHLEWLKNLETVAREENLILEETAKAGGTSVINLDDPWIQPMFNRIKEHGKIGFTLGGSPAPNILAGALVGDVLEVSSFGQKSFQLKCPLPGEHNARNFLGAIATALVMGVNPKEMEKGLSRFVSSGGRSQLEVTKSGVRVLCDYYNANPASMRAAFKVAENSRNKNAVLWLCLADMKELGDVEEQLHRSLAGDIAALGGDVRVMLYGERMKWLSAELNRAKPGMKIEQFLSPELMGKELARKLTREDFVLIKGSRSMAMEKVWNVLKPEKCV